MIDLSIYTILALLEGIVVLLIVIGVLLWRSRQARARDRIAYIDGSDTHPTPALYLESEVAKTRNHLDSLTKDKAETQPGDAVDTTHSALGLRAALLKVEAELSQSLPEQRDHNFWQGLADRLDGILSTSGYQPPSSAVATTPEPAPGATATGSLLDEEDASVTGLVEQQAKTIDYLRNYIQEILDQHDHQPSPDPGITGKFDDLERANKELSSCVAVLEDENEFLRHQIAALLKLD